MTSGFPGCKVCNGKGVAKTSFILDGASHTREDVCACVFEKWGDGAFIDAIKVELLAEGHERDDGRDFDRFVVWPSSLGDVLEVKEFKKGKAEPAGCRRRAYLRFFPHLAPPMPKSAKERLNFAVGEAYQSVVETYMQRAGLLFASEHPLRDHPLFSGRVDELAKHPRTGQIVPVEQKSHSSFSFYYMDTPKPGYAAQTAFYAWRLNAPFGVNLNYDKESGALKEFEIAPDETLIEAMEKESARLVDEVKQDRAAGRLDHLPRIPEGLERGGSFPCYWYSSKKGEAGFCQFFRFCHERDPRKDGDAPAGEGAEVVLTLGGAKKRGAGPVGGL